LPKLHKEKRDEVIKLLKQGYTIAEVVEKTGISRNTVSKINKSIMQEDENKKQEPTESYAFSAESMKKLQNIQGLYGYKTLDETVNQIYEDVINIMPLKYEYDLVFTKTISEVFRKISEDYKANKKKLDNIINAKKDDWIQRLVLKIWGVDSAVLAFHDISSDLGFKGTIIEFMANAVIGSFEEKGWKIKHYHNTDIGENSPILVDPMGNELKYPFT